MTAVARRERSMRSGGLAVSRDIGASFASSVRIGTTAAALASISGEHTAASAGAAAGSGRRTVRACSSPRVGGDAREITGAR
jgi:hypothetical protein